MESEEEKKIRMKKEAEEMVKRIVEYGATCGTPKMDKLVEEEEKRKKKEEEQKRQ